MATKAESMRRWEAIEPSQNPLEVMNPIPYKAEGSRYGACGIRIDGTPEFIDAVLSNLKELLEGEGADTRLELARNEVKPTEIQGKVKTYSNAEEQAECCYIRLHERGRKAAQVNNLFGLYR